MSEADAPVEIVSLALIEGASWVDEAGTLVIKTAAALHRPPLRFPDPTPGLKAALLALEAPGAPHATLAARVLEHDGPAGFGGLHRAIGLLDRCALLARSMRTEDGPLAEIQPISIYYRHDAERVDPETRYRLSRFALCRRDGEGLVVESPLGHGRVLLRSPLAATAFAILGEPRTSAELASATVGLLEPVARELMNLLANAGALVAIREGQGIDEDADPTLAQWEFHDLLFHTRSRLGRHSNGYGGTYRFKGRFESLPATKPAMSETLVALKAPDLEERKQSDRPFAAVLEARRSVREQGATPIHVDQLAEFLYRAAHVQKIATEAGVSFRPHPGGGAIHELEIYPLVHSCGGLDAGLYHYDALGHRLEKVAAAPNRTLDTLLQMAAITSERQEPPQVLLIVAARFQRMQWKYQSMAYNVMLKNVGALYQTFYLVATAMGLAPCALGGGHADLFAQAAGLDYFAETSVGEFILGSARE